MSPVGINFLIDENYENDVIDLSSYLDFTILHTQNKGIITELHRLRERIKGMLQDNADRQEAASPEEEKASSLEEEQASSPEEEPSQDPGAESEVGPAEEPVVQPRVTRASTRSNPNTDDTYGSSLTPSQLLYLTKGEPRIKIMDMRVDSAYIYGEPFLPYKAFTYATSNLHDKRFSEEEKRVVQIPRTYTDAINSPEHKEWEIAIDKEMDNLKDHDVYDLVLITSVPHDNKIIGSRFVFKQKTNGRFKARLSFKDTSKNRVLTTESPTHRYAESAAFA